MGFEPTYEELKHITIGLISPLTNCFEPTYEELKHVKELKKFMEDTRFWAYLWGIETAFEFGEVAEFSSFEPTYEELKPTKSFNRYF